MLYQLRIENFAIIQRLELELHQGLTAFTGETGAGKSIILDAVLAVVGGKVDATLIRAGADRALVEGEFKIPAANRDEIHAILGREELLDDPGAVTLAREIRREGRSVARVNGRSVNAGLLRELGAYLVDIHGQSEHLSLLNVRSHLGLLDRYAGVEGQHLAYRQLYRQDQALRRELADLRAGEQEAAQRSELLRYQLEEIELAHLKPSEEEDLRHERDRLANAESLAQLAQQGLALLEEGSPEAPAITELSGRLVQAMSALSRIDPTQAGLYAQAQTAAETLGEVAHDLQGYLEQIEFNPRKLEQAEERLNLIHTLKRKYGGTIEAVLAHAANSRQKLDAITHAAERIAELDARERELLEKLSQSARELSQQRKQAAKRLSQAVEGELNDLRMEGARFAAELHNEADPAGLPWEGGERLAFDERGVDRCEFLIAPNPGEGLKPLVRIASGGETSRLMLALKNVLVRADAIPTLIFDEIDQGIGGRVGAVVGEKLWQLGRQHQVLCVTHLPQLAAFSDDHWRVRKFVEDGRTLTDVERLQTPARLDELAMMLGGVTEANRYAAQEALSTARQRAKALSAAKI
jgi:DNA repair protein RecN (Recombination protein N)